MSHTDSARNDAGRVGIALLIEARMYNYGIACRGNGCGFRIVTNQNEEES
ncbi:MAG: hypothetical protein ACE5EQ_03730 [Phycisphaerae bacterium]